MGNDGGNGNEQHFGDSQSDLRLVSTLLRGLLSILTALLVVKVYVCALVVL